MSLTTGKSKICSDCKLEKPLIDFRYRPERNYYLPNCRSCNNNQEKIGHARRYKANPEKYKIKAIEYYWKNPTKARLNRQVCTYTTITGMSKEEIQNYLASRQTDICDICQTPCPTGKALSIDHCHETNIIRGLLCVNCNQGLGKFKDSIKLLDRAIQYLSKER